MNDKEIGKLIRKYANANKKNAEKIKRLNRLYKGSTKERSEKSQYIRSTNDDKDSKESNINKTVFNNDDIYIGNVNIMDGKKYVIKSNYFSIQDGIIYYEDKKIKLEKFNDWRKLDRNIEFKAINKTSIEEYIKETQRFRKYCEITSNRGREEADLRKEFEEMLEKEFLQKEKSAKRKKDKFGYYVEKDNKEKNFDKKQKEKNRETIINGKRYNGPVSMKTDNIYIGNFEGEAIVSEDFEITGE